jgi:hypothetical protein
MIFSIDSEKLAITVNIKRINLIACDFVSQMHNLKEIHQLNAILNLIENHLEELSIIYRYNR